MKICVMEEYVQKIVVRCFGNEVTCDVESSKFVFLGCTDSFTASDERCKAQAKILRVGPFSNRMQLSLLPRWPHHTL